jgi:secreted trypsin-like serine protease
VLTAAHCVVDRDLIALPAEAVDVFVGSQRLDKSTGYRVAVRDIIVYPDYREPRGVPTNDVALLELAESVNENLIAPAKQSPAAGTSAIAVGWGGLVSVPTPTDFPMDLQEVELPIVSNADCNSVPVYSGLIDDTNMVCAGFTDMAKDACVGDSGGPLMVERNGEFEQVGIVSFGPPVCGLTYGGYTRVSAFESWIRSYVGNGGGQVGDGGNGAIDPWWLALVALIPLVRRGLSAVS